MKSHEQEIQELKKRVAELEQKVGLEEQEQFSQVEREFDQICQELSKRFGDKVQNPEDDIDDYFEVELINPDVNITTWIGFDDSDIEFSVSLGGREIWRCDKITSCDEFFGKFDEFKSILHSVLNCI